MRSEEATVNLKDLFEPTRILLGSFFVVFLLNAVLRRRRLGPFDNTEKFACIFALMLIASALFLSKRTAFSLRIACDAFIIPFVAYFCARRLVMGEDQLRRLVRVFGYLGVALIGIGLVERLTTPGLFSRVEGPFEGRDALYIVMVVVFFTVLVDWIRSRRIPDNEKQLPPVVQKFVLSLAPVVVLLGWGRGNVVALLSGIWIFVFLGLRLLDFRPKIAMAGLLFLLGPIMALALYEMTPQEIVESRLARTSTVYSRLGAWQNIIDEIAKSPVFGIGLNNLRDALDQTTSYVEGVKSETHAHNSPLSLLAELGLVGFLVFAAIVGSIIRTGLNLYRTGPNIWDRWRGIAIVAIMGSYVVSSLFANTLYIPAVSHVYIYMLVGGVAGMYGRQRAVSALSRSRNSRWIAAKMPAGI